MAAARRRTIEVISKANRMKTPTAAIKSAARTTKAKASPWADLDEAGSGLSVNDFLTTVLSRAANALRRTITVPYADRFGLSVSEWRMLSVLADARTMSFADLVVESVTDKAQVSRTLRLMEERALVRVVNEGINPRWKQMQIHVTQDGLALYQKVMPAARRAQAAMIRKMTPAERVATHRALTTLRKICEDTKADGIAE
jgi:DNA-binding MarR family transcriptional regulator